MILRDCTRNSDKNVEDNIVINSDNSLLLLTVPLSARLSNGE